MKGVDEDVREGLQGCLESVEGVYGTRDHYSWKPPRKVAAFGKKDDFVVVVDVVAGVAVAGIVVDIGVVGVDIVVVVCARKSG